MTQATDILSAERIAEIRERAAYCSQRFSSVSLDKLLKTDIAAFIASHDAQAAEIARLRELFQSIPEWDGANTYDHCPCCRAGYGEHKVNCPRVEALQEPRHE